MKSTRDKEEYRRASAIKQKMEGVPYSALLHNSFKQPFLFSFT
jgi:hypothetical protein